jgi:hypothetical protein
MGKSENAQRVTLDSIDQSKRKSAERETTSAQIERLANIGRFAQQGDYPPYLAE